MANRRYKEIVRALLDHFRRSVPSGRKYQGALWKVRESRYGIRLDTVYKTPSGPAEFFLFFRWDEALCDFKLHLVGKRSAHLNRIHSFKSGLEDSIAESVEWCCKEKGVPELYSTDPEA